MSSESSVAEPFSKLSSFRCLHLSVNPSSDNGEPRLSKLPSSSQSSRTRWSPGQPKALWLQHHSCLAGNQTLVALGNGCNRTNVTRNRLFGKQSCHQLCETKLHSNPESFNYKVRNCHHAGSSQLLPLHHSQNLPGPSPT